MLTTASPIVAPSEDLPPKDGIVTRRHGVILISIVEMLGSIGFMALYLYALGKEPEWTHYLVPIPDNLCNAQGIVNGVMYIFVLLCVLELLLALYLFEGARKYSVGRARFWLSSMLTYLCLVTVVILGLDLGGIRSPTMNSAAFINIFIRFMEILIVYSWTELETMRRMKTRRSLLSSAVSTSTLATRVESPIDDHIRTPPPSYSSAVPILFPPPPARHTSIPSSSKQRQAENTEDPTIERARLWEQQWDD